MPEPQEREQAGPTPSPDSREPQPAGREAPPSREFKREQPQAPADGFEADQPQDPCPICGAPLFGVHCKLICPNCGYREDCSDLFRL
jgi:hypothetical protein